MTRTPERGTCSAKYSLHYNETHSYYFQTHPAGNYMFKVNKGNTRASREICTKLTTKIPERRQQCRSSVFNVNFKHISHLVLVFLLLTLSR